MPSKQTFGYETALENKEGEGLTHIADNLANCKWLIDLQKEFKAALDHYTRDFQKLVDMSVAPHPKTLPYSENFMADNCSAVHQTLEKLSEQFEAQSISKLEDAYKENAKELATLKATVDKSFKERAKLDGDKHKNNVAMTALSQKLDGSEPSGSTLKEKARLEKKSEEITEQLTDVNKRFVNLRNQMETLDWEALQDLITVTKVTSEELSKAGSKFKAIGEEIKRRDTQILLRKASKSF
ncbi:Hypothetical protein GLP15_4280 [Giardia lamblia P15]|uniref:Uncharacterized protein n=1 Tax=Giardia intestinalis (strain P15) TaxID=658858 RepID=E1EVM8_GIAIA|nr:Hypothetical protein GLP15_4280 [Giardia lamblia P15]